MEALTECSRRETLFPPIPVNSKFNQLMNIHDNHWICVSNVIKQDCLRNCVRDYDSALESMSLDTKKAVCSLFRPKENIFHFDFVNVPQQPNFWDCGLFAVTFAIELVYGKSPSCCACLMSIFSDCTYCNVYRKGL